VAWIRSVPRSEGGPELAAVYDYMREVGGIGVVGNIVKLFSLRPASMRRMIRTWELAMWVGGEPRQTRELAAAVVSRINQCVY
jgi:alkylhydroperoxidase family enzyme